METNDRTGTWTKSVEIPKKNVFPDPMTELEQEEYTAIMQELLNTDFLGLSPMLEPLATDIDHAANFVMSGVLASHGKPIDAGLLGVYNETAISLIPYMPEEATDADNFYAHAPRLRAMIDRLMERVRAEAAEPQ